MRLIKRTLRLFVVALLTVAFVLSIAACKTRGGSRPEEGVTPPPSTGDDGNGDGETKLPDDNTPPDVSGDTSGIDWTKYWDGTTSGGGVDGFTFNKSVSIGDVSSSPVGGTVATELGEGVAVSFNSNGGTAVDAQSVEMDGIAVKPSDPVKSGSMFAGWYEDNTLSTLYDFGTKVSEPVTLYAKWETLPDGVKSVSTYSESFAVEFTGAADTTVQYKAKDASSWTTVDAPLVRSVGTNLARVDVVGLAAGEYSVKVGSNEVSGIVVDEYDRSGYAHFNYTAGVGAYNDDGTIKNNTLVIYVTESNKNNVSVGYVDGKEVSLSQYLWQGKAGIGWILNNRAYGSDTERANYGIQKLTSVYGAVAVRIIGKVNAEDSSDGTKSLIDGLTVYNSTDNGGSVGDNGRMARITNAKNLTIEGIGEDACMYGWGIHFVANDNNGVYPESGKSFEVRNITFANYPEDAIGMEGTQGTSPSSPGGANASTNYLLAPVERCWIHNNVFLPGYCSSPAESDKKEGDGSCDFKRGQYYTLSYNYFEYCHKTNLIGSADASLTYNVTMHHNYWYNCGSRQPLARRANIHFYNNYIFGDATDSNASLSYVSSFRANCLLFSEANYFDGSKNVTQKKDGVGVAWNNIYYACNSENLYTELSSRTETVTNSCAYIKMNIDYSKFYVNDEQFYYDSANKVSDCLLDSATGARVRVMTSAGVNGFGVSADQTHMNKYEVENAVNVDEDGLEINLEPIGKAKVATTVENIYFAANNGWSSGLKIRGQGITFTLTAPTEIVVSTSSTGDLAPELIDATGRAWATKFTGTLTLVLPKGTYIIASGQKDKDSYITGLSFADTEASSGARVEAAQSALAAIPSSITLNDEVYIKAAQAAYSALRADEQSQIDSELYEKLGKAITALNQLKVDYVIARIDYIGTVTIDSYNRITAADTAYSELSATLQSQITNYSTLTAAWTAYGNFAAQNVINKILDLPEVENIQKINSFEILDRAQMWFDAVNGAFDGLTSEEGQGQQGQVKAHDDGKTYAKLTGGLDAIEIRRAELEQAAAEAEALEEFLAALEEVTDVSALSLTECTAIVHLYNSLSEAKQAEYAENEKYVAIVELHKELSAVAVKVIFDKDRADFDPTFGPFTVAEGGQKSVSAVIGGETFTKAMEVSSSAKISFILDEGVTKTLVMYFTAAKAVKIDGTVTKTAVACGEDANNSGYFVLEIELTGTGDEITITKDSASTNLLMIEMF